MSTAASIGSLFSGVGGLDLAVEAVTGGRVVWHAEVDLYASAVLAARWPDAPNLGDVRAIKSPPHVAVMCGGFPCQDVSNCGKRKGIDGEKSGLWSEFARLVREVGPSLVFVENVAALRARGLGVVLGDLASCGFDAQWSTLTAAAVGATHRRDRLFLLAYRDREALRLIPERGEQQSTERRDTGARHARRNVADTVHDGRAGDSEAHDDNGRDAHWDDPHGRDAGVVFPPGPADGEGWVSWTNRGRPVPGVHRGAHGSSRSVDARRRRRRLRHLGNAVVPRQAAAAFLALAARARAR